MWCVSVLKMLRIVCVDQVFDEIAHKLVCIFLFKMLWIALVYQVFDEMLERIVCTFLDQAPSYFLSDHLY